MPKPSLHLPFLLLLFLLFSPLIPPASAQVAPGSGWSRPLNLSESLTSSSSPAIAAGPFGDVHVFWSEDLGGVHHLRGIAPQPGNAILYRRLSQGAWTEPLDIFYGSQGSRLDRPSAVVDKKGFLHLAWIQNNSLFYSYVPVLESTRVKAWSAPLSLADGRIDRVQLLDLGDQLLAIYSQTSAGAPGLHAIPVKVDALMAPTLIWQDAGGLLPLDLSAAVDGRSRLHVVWSIGHPVSPAAVEVRYANSEDGGASWTASRLIARQTSIDDSLQFAVPWVAARGEDEIHIQWAQGRLAYRWHRYSRDGGKSWSKARQIWPDLISQTNSQAAGTDGDGNLYWVDILRYPNGAYLIPWGGTRWKPPELFYLMQRDGNQARGARLNVHFIRLAISSGNQVHIVFQDQDQAEIWTMHTTLSAKAIPTLPFPESASSPPTTAPAIVSVTVRPLEATQAFAFPTGQPADLNDFSAQPGFILVSAVLPTLLFIVVIVYRIGAKNHHYS